MTNHIAESMNDQRSTAEPPSPIQSVIRAVRSVIRARFGAKSEGTGTISSVKRAHTRLENAVRRVPRQCSARSRKEASMDDVKRLGEIG